LAFHRPTLLTACLGLICLAILLVLGFWQLERREWKRDLLATVEARLALPAEPLPAGPGLDWEFRRVKVAGSVLPNSWFRFPGHTRNGTVGDVLMLMVQTDDNRLILVEQAFVGFGEALPPLPSALAREGVLRWPPAPGWLTPGNDPAGNQWYVADPAVMAATARAPGEAAAAPFYLAPADWRPHLPNDHLSYAFTWFSFAAIFALVFALFHRQRIKPA
jgi:surfeit locus 1 family protein